MSKVSGASTEYDPKPLGFWVVFPFLLVSQLLDGLTTVWVTHFLSLTAAVESNPLARFVLESGAAEFLLIKALVAIVSSCLIVIASKRSMRYPALAKWVLLTAFSVGIVAAVLNTYSIFSFYNG